MYLFGSLYFYLLSLLKTKPKKYDIKVTNLLKEIHSKRISSGYQTIKMILHKKYGITVNHKKIQRIMRFLNIQGKQYREKYKFNKAIKKSKTFDNILSRNFSCNKPNEKWSINITYIPGKTRNTYLVCIKDLFDKRIVSYRNSNNISENFVLECVKEAFEKNDVTNKNLILHSDQGFHFASNSYIKLSDDFKIIGSHSREDNCHDNAPIESFFSIFKRKAFNFELPINFEQTTKLTKEFITITMKEVSKILKKHHANLCSEQPTFWGHCIYFA